MFTVSETYSGSGEVMQHARDKIARMKCVEELVRHVKIEKMSRHVGRVAVALVVIVIVTSIVSVFLSCANCGHN
jgi:hypothetical protein